MSIRLWPQEYERKDHITKAEKAILRYAARNFQDGHIVVGIDPVGLSSEKVKLGIPIWDYVTFPECKQIILNGKNWSLFFEDAFVRPEESNITGGKDAKTDWMLRINSIANKLAKESYSVPVDEYSYVKSVYDWLMGILVF